MSQRSEAVVSEARGRLMLIPRCMLFDRAVRTRCRCAAATDEIPSHASAAFIETANEKVRRGNCSEREREGGTKNVM
jgi:hypothetical protein